MSEEIKTISKPTTKTGGWEGGWEEVDINRVCFRGDRRAPTSEHYNMFQKAVAASGQASAGEIFKIGFQARQPDKKPEYESKKPTVKVGDINNPTAVCVSTNFFTTPFFPISGAQKNGDLPDVWSYAVYVEKGYNTKMKQVFHGMDIMKKLDELKKQPSISEKEAAQINWALFGEELAVANEIPPSNIIAAVKTIKRRIVDKEAFENGVSFELDKELVINPNFLPKSLANDKKTANNIFKATVDFLKEEIKKPTRNVTPNKHDGIVKAVTSRQDNLKAESGIKRKDFVPPKSPSGPVKEEVNLKSIDLNSVRNRIGRAARSSRCNPSQARHIPAIRKNIARIKRKQNELAIEKNNLEEELDHALGAKEEVFWV